MENQNKKPIKNILNSMFVKIVLTIFIINIVVGATTISNTNSFFDGGVNASSVNASNFYDDGVKLTKDYSCVVATDGSGDQTTIQACINSISNGTVYIKEGIYEITETINVSESVKLIGAGINNTIIYQANGANEVAMIENDQFDSAIHKKFLHMEGFTIDCNVENQNYSTFTAAGSHGAGMRLYTDYSLYKDIYIRNCAQFGGIVLYGRHNVFDNIWIVETKNVSNSTNIDYATGFFITSVSADNNILLNPHCRGVDGHCIFLEDFVDYTQIINLDVDGSQNGINAYQANYTTVIGGQIRNCVGRGIVFDTSYHHTVSNVLINNCTHGISELNGADFGVYTNNEITGTTTKIVQVGLNSVWGYNVGSNVYDFANGTLSDINEIVVTNVNASAFYKDGVALVPDTNLSSGGVIDGNIFLNSTSTNHIYLSLNNDASTPTLAFGDGDSGLYENSDDSLTFAFAGSGRLLGTSTIFESLTDASWRLIHTASTSTVPTLAPNRNDANTGIGSSSADNLHLIAGGTSLLQLNSTGLISSVDMYFDNTEGIYLNQSQSHKSISQNASGCVVIQGATSKFNVC